MLGSGLIPATGSGAFAVEEYPLVEQSTDNPTHLGFLDRIPGAVTTRRAPWRVPSSEGLLEEPNELLAPLGFHLAVNPTPPFSAYALYQGDEVIQKDIALFWPATINAVGSDFLLPYRTVDGTLLVASRQGLRQWPGQDLGQTTPPVYIGNRLAFAASDGQSLSVLAEGSTLYTTQASSSPQKIHTYNDHWVIEFEDRIIQDGQELNSDYEETFGWQVIRGKPFFFFVENGISQMSYDGQTLPYQYDAIVHGGTGDAEIFNPGGNDHMVWFYALRDGLWYYVEAGVFD